MRDVFVFGSNMQGIHGAGAALEAREKWGAEIGVGVGATGYAYAIPTKYRPTLNKRQIPLNVIQGFVDQFIEYANNHEDCRFLVTRLGCGLAGYKDEEIGPMFSKVPSNVVFVGSDWEKYRQKEETVKTTVINIKDAPANWQSDPQYVYIGRPGKGLTGPWGNPHVVDRECPVCNDPPHHKKVFVHSRGTAVEEFRKEMMKVVQDHKLLAKHSIEQLRGKTLVCFCKPLPCHGDVYVEILENVLPDLYQENLEKEQIQKEEKPMLFARDGDGQKYLKHMEEQKAKPKLPDLKNKIVAVTGHRPDKLGGYDRETEQKLIDFATMVLKKLEPLYVITGMALGWDQAVAQACIDLSIPFHAYIPGTWQPNKWRANSKDVWEELMEHAQEIINCDPDERGYAAWKLDHRNKQMVDAAHYVLALWDGSSGGTGNCVAYARTQNKFLMQLWNTWQKGGWF